MKKNFLLKLFATVMLICLSIATLTACENEDDIVNLQVKFMLGDEIYAVVEVKDNTVEFPPTPQEVDRVFEGWFLDKDSWAITFDGKFSEALKLTLEVYGKWSDNPCEHVWSPWVVNTEPTCSTVGNKGRLCKVCGKIDVEEIEKSAHSEEVIPALEATCHSEGSTGGKKCSVCNEILIVPQAVAKTEHNYVNGVCANKGCGAKDPNHVSEGLEFALNEDGLSYSVTGIGTCTDTNVVIPSVYNEKPVTEIGDFAFYDCSRLTNVTIPNSVTSIGCDAFSHCCGLTSITIPNSVTSIGDSAFESCWSLRNITIPDSVNSIGYRVFTNCSALKNITVDENNTKYHSKNNCIIETDSKILIAGCNNSVIPDDGSVISIGEWSFCFCGGLTSIVIPNSVTSIGDYAFSNCKSLKNIVIGSEVASIGHKAFNWCYSLTSITVVEDNTKYNSKDNCLIETKSKTLILGCKNSIIPEDGSVTSIGNYAFYGRDGLTSITIPDSITSIGNWAFGYCGELVSATIGSGVISICGSSFESCSELKSITVAEDNTKYHSKNNCLIETESKTLILGCKNSAIPDDGSVISIGDVAFATRYNLKNITVPDSVISIGVGAFAQCSLTNVTLGKNVTSIGDKAFVDCYQLTSITIPNSVTSIGTDSFWDCIELTEIKFSGTVAQWNVVEKGRDWNDGVPAKKVICTDGNVEL